jgi:hypothetical protein
LIFISWKTLIFFLFILYGTAFLSGVMYHKY